MNTAQERLVKDVLRRLGSNNSYQGFRYVIHCVAMVLEENELRDCVKVLYVDAAVKYHTTQKCVERNIRTLSEIAWNGGYRDILYEVACYPLRERPTSREFIGILTDYVRLKMSEREEEQ